MGGEAGGEHAVIRGNSAQASQKTDHSRLVEVDKQALAEKKRLLARVMTAAMQDRGDGVAAEVGWRQDMLSCACVHCLQAAGLVSLRRRVIDLEEDDVRRAEAQCTVVVSGAKDDDLANPR
jgi:ATP-dependent 26S proteasome regulatory subunit